jgi:hypothetical protein
MTYPRFLKKVIAIGLMLTGVGAGANTLILGAASEQRIERYTSQDISERTYTGGFLSYKFSSYAIGAEFTQSENTSSGVPSLMISSYRSSYWLAGAIYGATWVHLMPFLSGGLGFSIDKSETKFQSTVTTDVSRLYSSGFAGIGARFDTWHFLYLSAEGRLNFIENQDPQPCFSAQLRVGFEF